MDQIAVEGPDSFSIAAYNSQMNINMELQSYRERLCKVVIQVDLDADHTMVFFHKIRADVDIVQYV